MMPYRTQLLKGTTCTCIQELLRPMLILIGTVVSEILESKVHHRRTDGQPDGRSKVMTKAYPGYRQQLIAVHVYGHFDN